MSETKVIPEVTNYKYFLTQGFSFRTSPISPCYQFEPFYSSDNPRTTLVNPKLFYSVHSLFCEIEHDQQTLGSFPYGRYYMIKAPIEPDAKEYVVAIMTTNRTTLQFPLEFKFQPQDQKYVFSIVYLANEANHLGVIGTFYYDVEKLIHAPPSSWLLEKAASSMFVISLDSE